MYRLEVPQVDSAPQPDALEPTQLRRKTAPAGSAAEWGRERRPCRN